MQVNASQYMISSRRAMQILGGLLAGAGFLWYAQTVQTGCVGRLSIIQPQHVSFQGETLVHGGNDDAAGQAHQAGREAALNMTTPGGIAGNSTLWHDQEEKLYSLHLFEDMFVPLHKTPESTCRSFVMIVAGGSAMANVDHLVNLWGHERFDYAIVHYDNSSGAWNKFDWFHKVVSLTAQKQGKWWYVKRFAHPWVLKNYCYFHLVEADTGSPAEHPFILADYEDTLLDLNITLAQPALSSQSRTGHEIVRKQEGNLFRYTDFVEIGPLVSIKSSAYSCVWDLIAPEYVTGFGLDVHWCNYLSNACGYPLHRSCAVIDEHYIDHLDTKTASASNFNGRSYMAMADGEWHHYNVRMDLTDQSKE